MDSNNKLSIYNFYSAIEYLKAYFEFKKNNRINYSMRQFSLDLGYGDSGSFYRIVSGKRELTLSRSQKIVEKLKLNSKEKLYFFELVLLQNVNEAIKIPLLQNLRSLYDQDVELLKTNSKEDIFSKVSSHRYLALRESFRLKHQNFETIKKIWKLDEESHSDFDEILTSLIETGLLKEKENSYEVNDDKPYVFLPKKASVTVKQYHGGWLNSAQKALHTMPIDERFFFGTTLTLSENGYSELVLEIEKFHKKILELSTAKDGDQVVHLESFAIPVTSSIKKFKGHIDEKVV